VTKWRFNLRQSKDLSLIGELTGASGKSLTLAHNTPGSANWDYSMSDELAKYIQPINTCISAERYNWRATLALNNEWYSRSGVGLDLVRLRTAA
jgi:hypothetical protein